MRRYGSRPIRARRGPSAMAEIRLAIEQELEAANPMTARQLYYRLVSRSAIAKTEQEYKTVIRLLGDMRRDGSIPFAWLVDNTRWMRKPRSYDDLTDALEQTARLYRRNVWREQAGYVEIWLEKDALAGVIYPETEAWDVPLMVTRGYPSLSYLHEAASAIACEGKPAVIYYLGDRDPSGVDIPRVVERGIREFAPDVDLTFVQLAVTPEQIEALKLPTRPTKKTDSRARHFEGESVEVDAIPPATLRELVRDAIEQHIDRGALDRLRVVEQAERETLRSLALSLPGSAA